MIKKLFLFVVFSVLLALSTAGGLYYWYVVLHPGEEVQPENINSILGKESPVFYNDGITRLGVFFDEAHRQYVEYDQIPLHFINATVASEDNRFFSHFGFDVMGIMRAALRNIQSGRIVEGGSTLTQQTAKNLFKRQSRTLLAKLKELLFALRLEYHYSKEEIFEFYANQFFVSGNGHGLGVAARYYFDKKPAELTLLQCAYIAGSVKRPNYYNPFIKNSAESREKALASGRGRTNYVLDKMLELGMISQYEHDMAWRDDFHFKKGEVGFPLDHVMDLVKDAVATPEISDTLEKLGISNIATSGVRIITTIDQRLQEQTIYALRHDLSRLDVRLRGYEREEVQRELGELKYAGDIAATPHSFLFGRIADISGASGKPRIEVDLGERFGRGIIEKNGIDRLVKARVHWQQNPWTQATAKDYTAFLQQLRQDDKVWVSVRGRDEQGNLLLDLEKFPQINGGALVVRDGIIKAMAGGVENRFFNRAIYAKRTMGSSFKPLVFAAALQLGWNSADLLQNSRDVFIYHNQPYFPRPDHKSPFAEVSMSWAGAKSENLASVWLLAHLCDKLSDEQFDEVAQQVGLAPKVVDGEKEPYASFRSRIRDRHGIVLNLDTLRQAAYSLALKHVEPDFIFAGRDVEFRLLEKMQYGLGFTGFSETIDRSLRAAGLSGSEREELLLRKEILADNFLALEALARSFTEYREQQMLQLSSFENGYAGQSSRELGNGWRSGGRLYYDRFAQRYCFLQGAPKSGMVPVSPAELQRNLLLMPPQERDFFWNEVYLGGTISFEAYDMLRRQIDDDLEILRAKAPYDMEVLRHVADYRVLVGLQYVISLARECGINSALQPVLSFPLGSNVVTLLETLRVYEAMVTGEVTLADALEESRDALSIIDRIESAEGEILFQPQWVRKEVVAPETAVALGHILENVVKYGTGSYADKHIKLSESSGAEGQEDIAELGLSIPVLGKTGTANSYTNASFFGFLPLLAENRESLSVHDGYAVGVYVGFDDNVEMRKGATRISGSAGALPIWCDVVNSIVRHERYADQLDAVDLTFNGLSLQRRDVGQHNFVVAAERGGIIPEYAETIDPKSRYTPSVLTFGTVGGDGKFQPARQFLPYWQVAPLMERTLTQ